MAKTTIKGRNGGTLTHWEKGQSGNPKGRAKNMLKRLGEAANISFDVTLSATDKRKIIEAMLEMSLAELRKLATNPETPVFVVVVAGAIKEDVARGTMRTLGQIFDRLYGKPSQEVKIDVAGDRDNVPLDEYSDAEVMEEFDRLGKVLKLDGGKD